MAYQSSGLIGVVPTSCFSYRKSSSVAMMLNAILVLVLNHLFISYSEAYYLDNNPYRHKQVLGPKASYVVEWTVNWKEKSITFQVSAETKGWVGFGLSRDGRMSGSDIVIGGVAPSGKPYFDDAHVTANRSIQIDRQQDWKLIGAWEKGKRTYITVKRPLETCDNDDYPITKDLVMIIWAYGLEDEVGYHMKRRGNAPVYLLDPQISDEQAHAHYRQIGPHSNLYLVQRWALTSTVRLAPKPTTVWCSVQRGPRLLVRHDIVGMGAYLPTRSSRRHVQQIRVFKCTSPQQTDVDSFFEPYVKAKGEECYMNERRTFPLGFCRELMYVYGRGGKPFYFPEDIGIPIGESQSEYFLLETTFDNPKTLPKLEIEAGVEIVFSHRQKPNAASLIQVGYGSFGTFIIPPKSRMNIYGSCGPRCTSSMFPKEGLNVFAGMLQTRSLGRQIRLQHFRGDNELKWILKDANYDNEYQQIRLLPKRILLLPGDQITTHCTYDSRSRNHTSFSGFSNQDEICTAYLYVSNRIPFFQCTSEYPPDKLLNAYGIKNFTWDLVWQERYVTEPRDLEGTWLGDIMDKQNANRINVEKLERDYQFSPHLESCPNIHDVLSNSQSKLFKTYTNEWQIERSDPIETQTPYLSSTVTYPKSTKEYQDAPLCKPNEHYEHGNDFLPYHYDPSPLSDFDNDIPPKAPGIPPPTRRPLVPPPTPPPPPQLDRSPVKDDPLSDFVFPPIRKVPRDPPPTRRPLVQPPSPPSPPLPPQSGEFPYQRNPVQNFAIPSIYESPRAPPAERRPIAQPPSPPFPPRSSQTGQYPNKEDPVDEFVFPPRYEPTRDPSVTRRPLAQPPSPPPPPRPTQTGQFNRDPNEDFVSPPRYEPTRDPSVTRRPLVQPPSPPPPPRPPQTGRFSSKENPTENFVLPPRYETPKDSQVLRRPLVPPPSPPPPPRPPQIGRFSSKENPAENFALPPRYEAPKDSQVLRRPLVPPPSPPPPPRPPKTGRFSSKENAIENFVLPPRYETPKDSQVLGRPLVQPPSPPPPPRPSKTGRFSSKENPTEKFSLPPRYETPKDSQMLRRPVVPPPTPPPPPRNPQNGRFPSKEDPLANFVFPPMSKAPPRGPPPTRRPSVVQPSPPPPPPLPAIIADSLQNEGGSKSRNPSITNFDDIFFRSLEEHTYKNRQKALREPNLDLYYEAPETLETPLRQSRRPVHQPPTPPPPPSLEQRPRQNPNAPSSREQMIRRPTQPPPQSNLKSAKPQSPFLDYIEDPRTYKHPNQKPAVEYVDEETFKQLLQKPSVEDELYRSPGQKSKKTASLQYYEEIRNNPPTEQKSQYFQDNSREKSPNFSSPTQLRRPRPPVQYYENLPEFKQNQIPNLKSSLDDDRTYKRPVGPTKVDLPTYLDEPYQFKNLGRPVTQSEEVILRRPSPFNNERTTQSSREKTTRQNLPPSSTSSAARDPVDVERPLKRPRPYYPEAPASFQQTPIPIISDHTEEVPELKRIRPTLNGNVVESTERPLARITLSSKETSDERPLRRPLPYQPLEENPQSRIPIESHSVAAAPAPPQNQSKLPTQQQLFDLRNFLSKSIFNKMPDISIPVVHKANTVKNQNFGVAEKSSSKEANINTSPNTNAISAQSFLNFFDQLAKIFSPAKGVATEGQSKELLKTLANTNHGVSFQNVQMSERRSDTVQKPTTNNIKLLLVQQTKYD